MDRSADRATIFRPNWILIKPSKYGQICKLQAGEFWVAGFRTRDLESAIRWRQDRKPISE